VSEVIDTFVPRELEYRRAASVEVRHPERVIELIAVPYDEDTRVLHRGRWIIESVAPGSFANVAGSPRNIIVNRGHDYERPIGKVVRLHPNDPRGLRSEVRIVKTPEGDDVLELAAEDLLGASVGFAAYPGGEHYTSDQTRRRITKAYLGHIALTGDPAYEGAEVLAVRSASPPVTTPTPNLDRLLAERRLAALGVVLPSGGEQE
jgi:HK97 family phage prohead protease